ncbi:hypothetical protein FE257_001216 [Aspergillus nanangensis]|uniref:Uncharacterized protein n=1 Tax=Aspergillus nanangensis TaxID=2582783 RepID=A0AAD4GPV5_ASPNN|nr:hypothetical protein FE257_001216 [Aspergillus nanangensis]
MTLCRALADAASRVSQRGLRPVQSSRDDLAKITRIEMSLSCISRLGVNNAPEEGIAPGDRPGATWKSLLELKCHCRALAILRVGWWNISFNLSASNWASGDENWPWVQILVALRAYSEPMKQNLVRKFESLVTAIMLEGKASD